MPNENDASLSDTPTFGDADAAKPSWLGKLNLAESRQSDTQTDKKTAFPESPEGLETLHFDDSEVVDLSVRYSIEKTLGKGGMGEVLLAWDTRLKRRVAIKRILGDLSRSLTATQRFLAEAQSIAALDHPNVVRIYDYGRDKNGPFFIMEYVDGGNLLERCRAAAIPLEEAVELTCQLCNGLGQFHIAGIIHRDIKPANVLLTKSGVPKLADFGLAKDENAELDLSKSGALLGTFGYMSPEQRENSAPTDSRSDLWSLAATLYQMVTGETPSLMDLDLVPQKLRSTLAKALKKTKSDRFQTALEFHDALQESLERALDLAVGQCLNCKATNELARRFCRGCGWSLQVPCLTCPSTIPVWDSFCGDCSANQVELASLRREEISAQQRNAEELFEQCDLVGATRLGNLLLNESDVRFHRAKEWAQKFLHSVQQESERQLVRMEKLLQEAVQHEQAYDYPSAIDALNQIPDVLRGEMLPNQLQTVRNVLARLENLQSECERLERTIRQRVKSRDLNGLLHEVLALQKLRPDREDLAKLSDQLIERDRKCDETFAAAQSLFQARAYEECLTHLAKIDASLMRSEIVELRERAQERTDYIDGLYHDIAGAVRENKLNGLLDQIDEYLTLKVDHEEMLNLRAKLLEREQSLLEAQTTAKVAAAQRLFDAQDYRGCLLVLAKITTLANRTDVVSLRKNAETIENRLLSLDRETKSPKPPKNNQELLVLVNESLALRRDNPEMLKRRESLLAEQKDAVRLAKALDEARDLRQTCQFDAASDLLRSLPKKLQTGKVSELLEDCGLLGTLRRQAMHTLETSAKPRISGACLDASISYENALNREHLEDSIFRYDLDRFIHFSHSHAKMTKHWCIDAVDILQQRKLVSAASWGISVTAILVIWLCFPFLAFATTELWLRSVSPVLLIILTFLILCFFDLACTTKERLFFLGLTRLALAEEIKRQPKCARDISIVARQYLKSIDIHLRASQPMNGPTIQQLKERKRLFALSYDIEKELNSAIDVSRPDGKQAKEAQDPDQMLKYKALTWSKLFFGVGVVLVVSSSFLVGLYTEEFTFSKFVECEQGLLTKNEWDIIRHRGENATINEALSFAETNFTKGGEQSISYFRANFETNDPFNSDPSKTSKFEPKNSDPGRIPGNPPVEESVSVTPSKVIPRKYQFTGLDLELLIKKYHTWRAVYPDKLRQAARTRVMFVAIFGGLLHIISAFCFAECLNSWVLKICSQTQADKEVEGGVDAMREHIVRK